MTTCNCFIDAGTGSAKNGFLIPNLSISLCFPVICGLCEWQVSGRSAISISPLFSHAHEAQAFFSLSMYHKYYLMGVGVVFSPLEAHHLVKPHINFTSLQRYINDSNAHTCSAHVCKMCIHCHTACSQERFETNIYPKGFLLHKYYACPWCNFRNI